MNWVCFFSIFAWECISNFSWLDFENWIRNLSHFYDDTIILVWMQATCFHNTSKFSLGVIIISTENNRKPNIHAGDSSYPNDCFCLFCVTTWYAIQAIEHDDFHAGKFDFLFFFSTGVSVTVVMPAVIAYFFTANQRHHSPVSSPWCGVGLPTSQE